MNYDVRLIAYILASKPKHCHKYNYSIAEYAGLKSYSTLKNKYKRNGTHWFVK